MAEVSPQFQQIYNRFVKSPLFQDILNNTVDAAYNMVNENKGNLPSLNNQLKDLVDAQVFKLEEAYKQELVTAGIDVRQHHHPQKALDPYTNRIVNEAQAELNQSASMAHPVRQFDGANVNPSRPRDNAPSDSLVTAQDLARETSNNEFKQELRNRLTKRLSMPGLRPSTPRLDKP